MAICLFKIKVCLLDFHRCVLSQYFFIKFCAHSVDIGVTVKVAQRQLYNYSNPIPTLSFAISVGLITVFIKG